MGSQTVDGVEDETAKPVPCYWLPITHLLSKAFETFGGNTSLEFLGPRTVIGRSQYRHVENLIAKGQG